MLIDGVDGSDNVSGSDEDVVVSVEISMGSLTKFGSPCVNECIVQYGNRDVWFVGLKGFSRICSDVGVELSNLMVGLRCYVVKEA